MPAINTSASARIGDADYAGVVTKTVLDALDSLFAQDSLPILRWAPVPLPHRSMTQLSTMRRIVTR